MAVPRAENPIDRLMEQASVALETTAYFEAERLCVRALARAHGAGDYDRMRRILLPLQEARRQKRLAAADAGFRTILASHDQVPRPLRAGCYLVQPPLIGIDARALRESADAQGVAALFVTREPLTRDGRWPIVAIGQVMTRALRARVAPPWPLERLDAGVTRDRVGPDHAPPPVEWFLSAAEALGDTAIAMVREKDPAPWQVEDLMEFLAAHPDHEKLHQRLAEACERAQGAPSPTLPRRRPVVDDPNSF